MNHVFVDFENVHQLNLSMIGSKSVSITLLLGARQTRLDVALVEKLMEHADSVQLVRLTTSGRNALDFALAYYLGRAVSADPVNRFHIVSKDTGFDTLIEHLRFKHIQAWRHDEFPVLDGSVPIPPPAPAAPTPAPKLKPPAPPKVQRPPKDDPIAHSWEHLRTHPNSRPKRKKTLISHLCAILGKQTSEADVLAVIASLQAAGHIHLDEKGVVTYRLEP